MTSKEILPRMLILRLPTSVTEGRKEETGIRIVIIMDSKANCKTLSRMFCPVTDLILCSRRIKG